MKNKVLILGSNGSLGKRIKEILKAKKNCDLKTIAKKKNADFNFNLENFKKLKKNYSK